MRDDAHVAARVVGEIPVAADAPPPVLAAAVEALREPVTVRADWRDAVLTAVAAEPAPWRARRAGARARASAPARAAARARLGTWARAALRGATGARVTLTPAGALAAAALCLLAGAGTMRLVDGPAAATPPGSTGLVARDPSPAHPATGGPPRPMLPTALSTGVTTTVRFTVEAPGARHVAVVGDFNGWNPGATPLVRAADGRTWTATVPLPPGRHVYAFSIDGGLSADPAAPRAPEDDFGTPNSVLVVSEAST
jgi:hypothetical protein